MATGNDKVAAIRKLIADGYDVCIRQTNTGVMVITITNDGEDVGFIMDKTINIGADRHKKIMSALDLLADKVEAGWPKENKGD